MQIPRMLFQDTGEPAAIGVMISDIFVNDMARMTCAETSTTSANCIDT
jgi:hypothetical protein